MNTSLLVSTGAVSCYSALIVNLKNVLKNIFKKHY